LSHRKISIAVYFLLFNCSKHKKRLNAQAPGKITVLGGYTQVDFLTSFQKGLGDAKKRRLDYHGGFGRLPGSVSFGLG
jgi:hypothetical protein